MATSFDAAAARSSLVGERERLLAELGEPIEAPGQMTYGSQAAAASHVFGFALALRSGVIPHTDADVVAVIDKMVKQRKDSIAQFEAEFAGVPAEEAPATPAWQRAAYLEGISAKETIEDLRGGSAWLS